MSVFKHTRGPWHCLVAVRQDHYEVFSDFGHIAPIDERAANARLIAAAPDLLEALRECAEYLAAFFEEGSEHRVIKAADAAIYKATGEGE